MRYLVGFVFVLALVASPLGVSAQADEEGTAAEPNLQEPATPSEPAPEEPALQLKLDSAGVEIVPIPPPKTDWHTTQEIERMELRVDRAAVIGLTTSGTALAMGGLFFAFSYSCLFEGECPPPQERAPGLRKAGLTLMAGGAAGMIVSVALIGVRKRKLRELQRAHYGTPPRVQWDLAQSRLVF